MTKLRRPATVFIAQAILLCLAAIWSNSLVFNLVMIVSVRSNASPLRLIAGVSVLVGIVSALIVGFWGLAKRRVWGRWLSVLSLSFMWVISMVSLIRSQQGQRFAENVWAFVAIASLNCFLVLVILRLAFARSVTKFFGADLVIHSEK